MARSDNQPIMTNGYPIIKWNPVMPTLDDSQDLKKIDDAKDQVVCDVCTKTNEKYKKDNKNDEDEKHDKDTGKDNKSDIHDDGDEREDPKKY